MRLHSLRLVNFRQHADTSLRFDEGLTGIIGPNGSGKSTILEAIAWALYGTPAARGTKDSIRSLRAGARASVRVELDFALGGHRYQVVRGLNSAELYLDGGTAPIANSITGVSSLLGRHLRMTLDEFFNTYFTGQKELSVMAAMGPTERAQFLSRVLGYDRLQIAQNLARDRRKLLQAEIAGLKSGMPDRDTVRRAIADAIARASAADATLGQASDRRARARSTVDELTPRWTVAQHAREQLAALAAELRVADGEEAALVRDAERIARELAEIATARGELEVARGQLGPLPSLRAEATTLEALAREEGRRQALLEAERQLAEELVRLRDRRGRLDTAPALEGEATRDLEARRAELALAEQEVDRWRTDWVRDRQEAETKIEQLKRQLKELRQQRDQLVELGENGICPTCSRPLGTHYRTVLELLDEQLETATVDGRYYKARIEQLAPSPPPLVEAEQRRREVVESVAKLERRLAKVQQALAELAGLDRELALKEPRAVQLATDIAALRTGYDAQRHEAVRAELDRLVPIESRVTRLDALVEREPQLRAEAERVATAVTAIATRTTALRERWEALSGPDNTFEALRADFERAAVELRSAELAVASAEAELTGARGVVTSAEAAQRDLDDKERRMAELVRDRRVHEELDRAYTDMRHDLNQQVRPEISEVASRFLADLTDGRYTELELDENYVVTVLEEGVPKPVISGGEEDLANLVLRLSISQMIAERAGQPFTLLILDEVFGSLDENRRHNVVDLLRRLHDRFEQVIVITHIEAVREGLDRVVSVRYDEESGTSVVEREPGGADSLEDDVHAGAAD